MATNAGVGAGRSMQSARRATEVAKKYTVQSHGIWERIRRALAVDPDRSTGVPLNPQYRNPPPGSNPPGVYEDPVTLPSGDIAENAYFKRDVRRNYPRLSVVNQADVVALLTHGSKAAPKDSMPQIQASSSSPSSVLSTLSTTTTQTASGLPSIQTIGEAPPTGLAAYFQQAKDPSSVLGPSNLPPLPPGMNTKATNGGRRYLMTERGEEGYPEEYPCRSFA